MRKLSLSRCKQKRDLWGSLSTVGDYSTPAYKLPQRSLNISFYQHSLQILNEERFQFVERDRFFAAAVIEIGVDRIRDDHQFFVVRILAVFDHVRIGVP